MEYSSSSTYSQKLSHSIYYSCLPPRSIPQNYQKECSLNLSQLFELLLLFQLIHSLRWNRWNRRNTLPAQPIPKNYHIPFTIPPFDLSLFLKIVKSNDAVLVMPADLLKFGISSCKLLIISVVTSSTYTIVALIAV